MENTQTLTLEERYAFIRKELMTKTSTDPLEIVISIMEKDFVKIHGPEHHFLDAGSFLVAYHNAGGDIQIEDALEKVSQRTMKMPGAMCGYWGVCGACASVGAALAVIHQTGPLSDSSYYADNMELTSRILTKMSKIGGPRCCKRNAYLSLSTAVDFVNEKYHVNMTKHEIVCEFHNRNQQCIKERCPFYKD